MESSKRNDTPQQLKGYTNYGKYLSPVTPFQNANLAIHGRNGGNGIGIGNGNVNGMVYGYGYVPAAMQQLPIQQPTPGATPGPGYGHPIQVYQAQQQLMPPPPKPEIFTTNTTTYGVVKILEQPRTDSGAMSAGVRLLKDPSGTLKVQKRLRMDSKERRFRASVEKSALKQIANAGGSKNINHIFEAFLSDGSPHCSLVLEYCDQGTLDHYLKSMLHSRSLMPESLAWHILSGMSAALAMCHYGVYDPTRIDKQVPGWNTICHLDIKPANVFLSSKQMTRYGNAVWPTIVLGDFGCAVLRNDIVDGNEDSESQANGTNGWFPPECFDGENGGVYTGAYGKPTDVWQMGGVVQVLCRIMPKPEQVLADEGHPCGRKYSKQLNGLITHLMKKDVAGRPTSSDVLSVVRKGMLELGLA